ncbi:MAG: thiosulfate oxidation carrier protein SoxY [Pseudomonadota bacterium]
MDVSKRQFLGTTTGAALALMLNVRPVTSREYSAEVEAAIADFASGRTIQTGRVKLAIPKIAENGFRVPIAVTVDHPMSRGNHVTRVLVLASDNPWPDIAEFRFSPLSGQAAVETRIRLARSQRIIALAETSQGQIFKADQFVEVTVGGCGS